MQPLPKKEQQFWLDDLKRYGMYAGEETILAYGYGSYWCEGFWHEGNFVFTDNRICFLGYSRMTIHYKDIVQMKKSKVAFVFPWGIQITTMNKQTGQQKTYKISFLSRQKRLDLLSEITGIVI